MAENNGNNDEGPIQELKSFTIPPSPDLTGRIRRDINRRTLAANGLEFSLTVMLQTFWEHLYSQAFRAHTFCCNVHGRVSPRGWFATRCLERGKLRQGSGGYSVE